MKQHSWDCIYFWGVSYHYSSLKHLDMIIQNIIIIIWVKWLKDMFHFIIIDCFDWGVIWVWKRVRGVFQWIILIINLYITIINIIMIESPHDNQNHGNGIGIRYAWFEVNCWRLAAPLSWWFSFFVIMNFIEFVHLSHKTDWE